MPDAGVGAVHAIILAGGRGTRLRSVVADRPKALVELDGVPVLEILTRRLARSGFRRLTLCVSHLAHLIEDQWGDGSRFGIAVDYTHDEAMLGTAGPLRLVPGWDTAALVMNCDVLSGLDPGVLLAAHRRAGAAMTVAVRPCTIPIDLGVLDLGTDGRVRAVWEKPQLEIPAIGGMYVIEPHVRELLPVGRRFDMPQLIQHVAALGGHVHAHRFTEDWHDIGTPARYERARAAFRSSPEEFLGTAARPDGPRPDHREDRHRVGVPGAVRDDAAGRGGGGGALAVRPAGHDVG